MESSSSSYPFEPEVALSRGGMPKARAPRMRPTVPHDAAMVAMIDKLVELHGGNLSRAGEAIGYASPPFIDWAKNNEVPRTAYIAMRAVLAELQDPQEAAKCPTVVEVFDRKTLTKFLLMATNDGDFELVGVLAKVLVEHGGAA